MQAERGESAALSVSMTLHPVSGPGAVAAGSGACCRTSAALFHAASLSISHTASSAVTWTATYIRLSRASRQLNLRPPMRCKQASSLTVLLARHDAPALGCLDHRRPEVRLNRQVVALRTLVIARAAHLWD